MLTNRVIPKKELPPLQTPSARHLIKIPAEGPSNAKIMIVGEGPGAVEVAQGRPFVGPAGKQLDRMLLAAGLERSSVYITNITNTLPLEPKERFFFENGAPTRVYLEGIIRVHEEMKQVNPNVVIPLGNYSLWALTQKMKISKWRGSILESTLLRGKKVVPTIHPSYYIRDGFFRSNEEPLGIWDLTKACRESEFPEIRLPSYKFVYGTTDEKIEQIVERMLKSEQITFDTEWYDADTLAYIGFTDSYGWAGVIPAQRMSAMRAYKRILEGPAPKLAQNIIFDYSALDRQGIRIVNPADDTMIAFNCCWGDLRKKDLATISSIYTDIPYYKDEVKLVGRNDRGGMEYCGKDCIVTKKSFDEMQQYDLPNIGARGYEISRGLIPIFSRASAMGLRVDLDKLNEMIEFHENRANTIEEQLSKVVGSINVRSPQQVVDLVYNKMGIGKKRKKRTSEQKVLMDIAASEKRPEIKTVLTLVVRARQDLNLLSRYFKLKILDRDGRVRTNWNVAGTRNARISATIPWWAGLPLQTVPDNERVNARQIFVPDEGHVFVGWDLEQAEARVVAALTNDFDLLEDMNSGIDTHLKLASKMPFGLSFEELTALVAKHGKDNVRQRFLAKKSRHAFNYLEGVNTAKESINREYLETGIGVTLGETQDLRNSYIALSPGLEIWWDQVKRHLKNDRIMINGFGRKRMFLGIFSDGLHRDGVAFFPQATIADCTNTSMVSIHKYNPSWDILVHSHDGGLMQVPEADKNEAIEVVRRMTNRVLNINRIELPIPSEIKVGYSWGSLHKVV